MTSSTKNGHNVTVFNIPGKYLKISDVIGDGCMWQRWSQLRFHWKYIWGFSLPSNIALLSNSAAFDCCESDQDASYSVTISHLLFTNRLALSYKVFYRKILRQLGKDSSYQLF